MNVYCTYYRGQYLASICGHWEREAYPLHRIHQGPIAVCSHTNTKKTRKTMIITAYEYLYHSALFLGVHLEIGSTKPGLFCCSFS